MPKGMVLSVRTHYSKICRWGEATAKSLEFADGAWECHAVCLRWAAVSNCMDVWVGDDYGLPLQDYDAEQNRFLEEEIFYTEDGALNEELLVRPEDVNVDPYAAREYDEDAPFVPVSLLHSCSDLCSSDQDRCHSIKAQEEFENRSKGIVCAEMLALSVCPQRM